jgi:hypothetical protein
MDKVSWPETDPFLVGHSQAEEVSQTKKCSLLIIWQSKEKKKYFIPKVLQWTTKYKCTWTESKYFVNFILVTYSTANKTNTTN